MPGIEMDLTPTGKAVYVSLIEEFKRCPTRFFRPRQTIDTLFQHDPEQINVCDRSCKAESMFPDSMGGVLLVSTLSELERLIPRLLEKPIFFTAHVERSASEMCSKVTYKTKQQLAVTVNTQHPHIHHLIQEQLAQGAEIMRQGKNFAVEFDFNNVLISWMKSVFISEDLANDCGCNIQYYSSNGKVTVTNYSEFEDMFACECPQVAGWVVCLPCCLLTFPFYRIHRAVNVEDLDGKVRGVEATYWSSRAQLQSIEETYAQVLALIAGGRVSVATAADNPPSYDAATRASSASGGPQTYGQPVSRQPGHLQPMGQQPGYTQPMVQQPVYTQPTVQHPGYTQPMVQRPGYTQPMGQQPGYTQPTVQHPGYT